MSEITRHFTSTTFVVFNGRTLLHFHKSLKMWLPPGGHIEPDELPHECAVREVLEETGLDVVLVEDGERVNGGISKEGVTELPSPRYILLEDINPHHEHIDLISNPHHEHIDLISNPHHEHIDHISNPHHEHIDHISNPYHQHIDLIWFARARTGEISPGKGESTRIRWFDLTEIDSDNELTEDIRVLAREAIEEVSSTTP